MSQNTLEIAIDSVAADDDDDRLSSCISEGKAAIEEDWEHQVTASSSSDGEPWTPNGEAPGPSPESTRASEPQTGQGGRLDASDAFTPVIGRQKKNSHISKLGVRLAVVTSDEFARFHKSTPKRTKARSGKSFRGISSLKANMAATALGTATYREVDYQNMKKLNPRPCHKHYLSVKGCPNGEDCAFGHHYELTQSELLAVRVLAKEMPCPYHLNGGCPQNVSSAYSVCSAPETDVQRIKSRRPAFTAMFAHCLMRAICKFQPDLPLTPLTEFLLFTNASGTDVSKTSAQPPLPLLISNIALRCLSLVFVVGSVLVHSHTRPAWRSEPEAARKVAAGRVHNRGPFLPPRRSESKTVKPWVRGADSCQHRA